MTKFSLLDQDRKFLILNPGVCFCYFSRRDLLSFVNKIFFKDPVSFHLVSTCMENWTTELNCGFRLIEYLFDLCCSICERFLG